MASKLEMDNHTSQAQALSTQDISFMTDSYMEDITSLFGDGKSQTSSIMYRMRISIGMIGLLSNALVVFVIGSSKSLRKTNTNRFIIHQSVCDGLVAVSLIFSTIFEDATRELSGISDLLYCRLWLTKVLLWGTLVTSTYNLIAMTLERYFSIVHPILHKMNWSTKSFVLLVCASWILGLGYNLAYMVPTTILRDGSCALYNYWPSAEIQKGQGIFTIVFQFFIPLAILMFCYIRMALVLKNRISPSSDESAKISNNMARARRNIIKTLAMIAVSFVVCWIWNQIIYLLFNLGYPVDFQSNFYHFTVIAVFINCCINPFIYMIKYEQFQRKIFRLRESCGKPNGTAVNGERSQTAIAT